MRPARSSTAPESAPDMGAASPEEESDPPPAPEQALSVVSRARQLPASSRRGEVAVMGVGRRPRPPGSRAGRACQHGGVHRDVVVVGGGIAGLAAAHELALAGRDVLLLEGSPETGGKLRVREVAGVGVDVGAEAMLNRRPEGVDLARAVGLDVEHPAVVSSRIWTGGALRPLPRS